MKNHRNQLTVVPEQGDDNHEVEEIITPEKVPSVIIEGVITMSKRTIAAVILGTSAAFATPVVTLAEVVDTDHNSVEVSQEETNWLSKMKGAFESTKKNVKSVFSSDNEKLLASYAKIDELLKRNAELERQLIDSTIDAGVEHNRAVMCASSVLTYLEEIGKTEEENVNGK
jgi:hypothetical protein